MNCKDCHKKLIRTKSGWCCPNGHGRLVPEVGKNRAKQIEAQIEEARGKVKYRSRKRMPITQPLPFMCDRTDGVENTKNPYI